MVNYLPSSSIRAFRADVFEQTARKSIADQWEQDALEMARGLAEQTGNTPAVQAYDVAAMASTPADVLDQEQGDIFRKAAASVRPPEPVAPTPTVPASSVGWDNEPAARVPKPSYMDLSTPAPSVGEPVRSVTPTTTEISGGGRSDAGGDILSRLSGYASRFGDEARKALAAVLVTEGGMTGAVGDTDRSTVGSHGPLQFYGAGGQLNNFAKAHGIGLDEAAKRVKADPDYAVKWALDPSLPGGGYMGRAIQAGLERGLGGPELATFIQRTGQVSESPERAGANYSALFSGGRNPLGPPQGGAEGSVAGGDRPAGPLVPDQFGDKSLSTEEAYAACGPAAAVAFARAYGRNPSLREATDLARTVGWTAQGGMNGVANQKKLLDSMGIPSVLDTSGNWNQAQERALRGEPVAISTPKHYFVADAYNPQTGQYHVGASGTAYKAGKPWMTAQEIASLGGGVNGMLFAEGVPSGQAPTADPDAQPEGSVSGGDRPETAAPPDPLERLRDISRRAQESTGQFFDMLGQANPFAGLESQAQSGIARAEQERQQRQAQPVDPLTSLGSGLLASGTVERAGGEAIGGATAQAAGTAAQAALDYNIGAEPLRWPVGYGQEMRERGLMDPASMPGGPVEIDRTLTPAQRRNRAIEIRAAQQAARDEVLAQTSMPDPITGRLAYERVPGEERASTEMLGAVATGTGAVELGRRGFRTAAALVDPVGEGLARVLPAAARAVRGLTQAPDATRAGVVGSTMGDVAGDEPPVLRRAIEHFGLTDNPREAGYILQDGRALDLSGKAAGGQPGVRARDHREVSFALEGAPKDTAIQEFARQTGAVRFGMVNQGTLTADVRSYLTPQQRDYLLRTGRESTDAVIDVVDLDTGGLVRSYEFDFPMQRRQYNELINRLTDDAGKPSAATPDAGRSIKDQALDLMGRGQQAGVVADNLDDVPRFRGQMERVESFPRAGAEVDGRIVRQDVPNVSSIAASLDDGTYTVLPGIREVALEAFEAPPSVTARSRALADQIKASGEINPLIVAVDDQGPYILEGANRYDALKLSGAKSFPAMVVVEKSARPVDDALSGRAGGLLPTAATPAVRSLATGAAQGGVAGGVQEYQETGQVTPTGVLGGAALGLARGGLRAVGPEGARAAGALTRAVVSGDMNVQRAAEDADRIIAQRRAVASGAARVDPTPDDVEKVLKTVSVGTREKWTDRRARLSAVEQHIEKQRGEPLGLDEKVWLRARVYEGRQDVALARLEKDVAPALTAVPKENIVHLDAFLEQMDNIDKAAAIGRRAGANAAQQRKFSGGASVQQEDAVRAAWEQRLGPETARTVFAAADAVWGTVRNLRERMVESGVWSREQADFFQERFPHYVRTNILDHMSDQAIDSLPAGAKTFSVGSNGVKKLTEAGTEKARQSPLSTMVDMTFRMEELAQKNDVMRRVAAWSDDPGLQNFVKRLGPDETVPRGYVVKSAFENGEKVRLAVAAPLESALDMSTPNLGLIGVALSAAKLPLQLGATALRPSFIAFNMANDMLWSLYRFTTESRDPVEGVRALTDFARGYRAVLGSDIGGNVSAGVMGGTVGAFQGETNEERLRNATLGFAGGFAGARAVGAKYGAEDRALMQRAREAGASIGMQSRYTNPDAIVRQLAGEHVWVRPIRNEGDVKKLLTDGWGATTDVAGLLWSRPLAQIGGRVEQAPRLAAFARAERQGRSATEAAQAARRATVDFSAGGLMTKQLNKAIPFINAATQASVEYADVWRKNPKQAAAAHAVILSTIVANEFYNRAVAPEDYADVSRFTKDSGLVIMSDKEPEGDGKRGLAFIPLRGGIGAMIPLVRETVGRMFGDNPREAHEIAKRILLSFSPVEPDASTLVPPLLQTANELAANYDYFRGRPIVSKSKQALPASEQYDDRTSQTARLLARSDVPVIGGHSPMKFDYAARGISPGPSEAILGLSDTIIRATNNALPEAPRKGEPGARDVPVVGGIAGRFLKTAGEEQRNIAYEQADRLAAKNRDVVRESLEATPSFQAATPDRQQQLLKTIEQELVTQAREVAGVEAPDPKDLGLPNKYVGIKDPKREREIDEALAKVRAWEKDPRTSPRPSSTERQLAARYGSDAMRNPLYGIRSKEQTTVSKAARALVEKQLQTTR